MKRDTGHPLCGVGFKSAHLEEVLSGRCRLDFLEVHAENYMVEGGPRLAELTRLRERRPLSIHGVGLSIGGGEVLDARHLDRLAALVRRFEPHWVSEHLAWSSHGGAYFNDLLPLPYDDVTLARVCEHIDHVQERLGRRLLLENPSTTIEFARSSYDEPGFLAEVQRRTGCALLLDVNNLYVSCTNHGRAALAQLDRLLHALPGGVVREIHLAGHAVDGAAVQRPHRFGHRRAIEVLGPVPTLIERDHRVPAFALLQAEALRARECMVDPVRPVQTVAPVAPVAPVYLDPAPVVACAEAA